MMRDMHQRRVLPALLFARVHLVQRGAGAVELVKVECRSDARCRREYLRMPQRQPQGPLPTHADAKDAQCLGRELPTRPTERHDGIEQIFLRRDDRIELGANEVEPPRAPAVRADASELELFERVRVSRVLGESFQANAMQEDDGESQGSGRIEYVSRFAADGLLGPHAVMVSICPDVGGDWTKGALQIRH